MDFDSYSEIFHHLKLDSVLYSRSVLGGDVWGLSLPSFEGASMFHIITNGSCLIEIHGDEYRLGIGDIVFLPRASIHTIKGVRCTNPKDYFKQPVKKVSRYYETLVLNDGEVDPSIIICGVVKIAHPIGVMLLNELPEIILMRQADHKYGSSMSEIFNLITREASKEYIGGETVITRLSDVLVIQTIRYWFESLESFQSSWIRAIRHEQIGKALICIHQNPGESWTLECLGKRVGMSRTTFSNKFSEIVGKSFHDYLTDWRMDLAVMRIKEGGIVNLDFIESLGYQSESAFRRAFKKNKGMNISDYRRLISFKNKDFRN